jgi:hypothetical protein
VGDAGPVRGAPDQTAQLVAVAVQGFRDVVADEATDPGDQDFQGQTSA